MILKNSWREDALSREHAHLAVVVDCMKSEWANGQAASVQVRSAVESVSVIQGRKQADQI